MPEPIVLASPLEALPGIGPVQARKLAALGLHTVGELLTHFPRRHEDRRAFPRFPTVESDAPTCVCGVIEKTALKRLPGGRSIVEVTLREREDHALSPRLLARWFGLPYLHKQLPVDQVIVLFGRPKRRGAQIVFDHPEWEALDEEGDDLVHVSRWVPVHAAGEGISPRMLRTFIHTALGAVDLNTIAPRLPSALHSLSRGRALADIHFPRDEAALAQARAHLVREEFFGLQLGVAARRADAVARPGAAHCGRGELLARFLESLPFALTGAQTRAIAELRADLKSRHPMNRLLQGDVGSGKTLVALAAMLLCVESGHQAALMAPTQILAEQHWLTLSHWLAPFGVPVELRTGGRSSAEPDGLFSTANFPPIVVGTHALLFEEGQAALDRLGLAVIDEQHKFGVLQRARLTAGRSGSKAPDVLVMSATPIPRTLAITLYGDLEVSTLDELPPGRGRIVTGVRAATKRPEAVKFIGEQLAAGRQAYLVHPLIDESEKLDARAAASALAEWRSALAPHAVGLLHGRMSAEEKDRTMSAFRAGTVRALVATTVIEVGVDVPNASVMLVENAERFGLAQLHQLRGRVGRGTHKSYCVLLCGAKAREAMDRLRILEETSDGFAVAEADLRQRGAGDMLGTSQSGLPPLRLGDLLADAEIMFEMRRAAQAIIALDPKLARREHAPLRHWLQEMRRPSISN